MQLERLQPYASTSEATQSRRRLSRFVPKHVAVGCVAVACALSTAGAATAGAVTTGAVTTGAVTANTPATNTPAAANPPALPAWARAYGQGHWSAVVELIEIIPEASRTTWHWLHLARANEKRLQLVEAFSAYERLLDVAAEGAAIAGMKDVERQARAESSELSHRIPWAEVKLDRGLPTGALVFVDQQWLEPPRLRSPYPVNPGWHTFLVESNGTVLAARRVFFEEGQNRVVPLNVLENADTGGALAAGGGALSDDSASGSAPGELAPVSQAAVARSARRRALAWHAESPALGGERPENLLRASYISLGVGLSATAIGTGLVLASPNTQDRTRLGGAAASYAVGFGGLVTGGVLWLLYRDAEKTSVNIANLQVEPRLYPSGATVRGTF